jgi:hypothetical protein
LTVLFMDVDPDAAITDSQNATTVHFVFVPRVRNIRTTPSDHWRDGSVQGAVGP